MAGGRPKKKYKFISPNGVEFDVVGLSDFCSQHGLSVSRMSALYRGKHKTHKGWKAVSDGTIPQIVEIDRDSFLMALRAAKKNKITVNQYISDIIELCAGGYVDIKQHGLK